MELLQNPVRDYAWGSPTAIPEILGLPVDGTPRAELWLGAHPASPSVLVQGGERLDTYVRDRAAAALGARVREQFGDRLPYLLKVLAATAPLSLQVHPSTAQAELGYERENAAGVPLDAPERSYKDPHHKPEMIVAMTPFEALCGFRSPAVILAVLEGLEVPGMDAVRADLAASDGSVALRAVVQRCLGAGAAGGLVEALVGACARRLRQGSPYPVDDSTVVELGAAYPADPGVLVALLLHRVSLEPGEALFLDAGNVHAYLDGTGIELMACSDNVLRGGLTPKHVDVDELLAVVDFTPVDVPYVRGVDVASGTTTWRPGPPELELVRVVPTGAAVDVPASGPRTVLCVQGDLVAHAGGKEALLPRGASVFVDDADGPLALSGTGTAFVAAPRQG